MSLRSMMRHFGLLLVVCLRVTGVVVGEDIDGVQPAAMDQPRVNIVVRRQASGKVLTAGDPSAFNVEAFLDTGASGVLLSSNTAEKLGVQTEIITGAAGKPVPAVFEDIGVGGSDKFGISEALYLSLAPYAPSTNTDDANAVDFTYNQTVGPIRTQVAPQQGGGDLLTELAMADLDVVGMPAMRGKIVVMNVKPVNSFSDTMRTYVYDPGPVAGARISPGAQTASPGMLACKWHVKLGYYPFARFTHTTPARAAPPTLEANPFIGPNPIPGVDGNVVQGNSPPMIAEHGGKTISGSWLLDTGSAASMISRKNAQALGVAYVDGTMDTDHPRLQGVPANRQFTLTISGIGGSKKATGFFLDELRVKTTEGQPLVFKHAPVLVSDITVKDPANGQTFTLDGVFGMNFLVASCMLDESGILPDMKDMTPSAFERVVIDQPAGTLGLQ